MRCCGSQTTSTAREVAAQFEALLFKDAFAPLAKAMGFYGDAVVATDTLPVVADLPAASVAARSPACPDCSALIADRARIAALTRSWPAQADPWQISPHYTVWIPLPKSSTHS